MAFLVRLPLRRLILIEPVGIETNCIFYSVKIIFKILIEPVGIETRAHSQTSRRKQDFNRTSWN